jgi:hypothetical protein
MSLAIIKEAFKKSHPKDAELMEDMSKVGAWEAYMRWMSYKSGFNDAWDMFREKR